MDSSNIMLKSWSASVILLINNLSGLIFSPYKAMRKIALKPDLNQVGIILFAVFSYFYVVNFVAVHNMTNFFFFLLSLFLTIGFFYICGILCRSQVSLKSLVATWSFSLFPTLLWFFLTLTLYVIIPPPRTTSVLGTGFSLLFVSGSLVLLLWKLTLLYLSVRFSLKTDFAMTMFLLIIYGVWFLPYTYALYFFSISRVPFI